MLLVRDLLLVVGLRRSARAALALLAVVLLFVGARIVVLLLFGFRGALNVPAMLRCARPTTAASIAWARICAGTAL